LQYSRSIQTKKIRLLRAFVERADRRRAASRGDYTQLDSAVSGSHLIWIRADAASASDHGASVMLEMTMSAESTRRAPPALLFLIGTMVSCPFLLLAFAISPLSGTWLRFVILALPFVALLPLWRWVRPHSNAVTSPLPRRAITGA